MEFNHGNSIEIHIRERSKTFINTGENFFTRIKDEFVSYRGQIVYGIGGKLVSIGNKTCYIPKVSRKRISIDKGYTFTCQR